MDKFFTFCAARISTASVTSSTQWRMCVSAPLRSTIGMLVGDQ